MPKRGPKKAQRKVRFWFTLRVAEARVWLNRKKVAFNFVSMEVLGYLSGKLVGISLSLYEHTVALWVLAYVLKRTCAGWERNFSLG